MSTEPHSQDPRTLSSPHLPGDTASDGPLDDAVWAVVITVLAAPAIAIVHPSWTALFVFGVLAFAAIRAGHLLARVCNRHLDRPRPLSARSQARVEAEIQRFHERHGLD